MSVNIGKLDQRIQFLKTTITGHTRNGDAEGTEAVYYSCWANVVTLSGSRRFEYEQIVNGNPHTITIRYPQTKTLTADMVIKWGGKRLTIQSLAPEGGEKDKLIITAVSAN